MKSVNRNNSILTSSMLLIALLSPLFPVFAQDALSIHSKVHMDFLESLNGKTSLTAAELNQCREVMLKVMNEGRANPNYRQQQKGKWWNKIASSKNLVNKSGLTPFLLDSRLNAMAQEQSEYQASIKTMTHDNRNYRNDYGMRMNKHIQGYFVREGCFAVEDLRLSPVGYMVVDTDHHLPYWDIDRPYNAVGIGVKKNGNKWYTTAVYTNIDEIQPPATTGTSPDAPKPVTGVPAEPVAVVTPPAGSQDGTAARTRQPNPPDQPRIRGGSQPDPQNPVREAEPSTQTGISGRTREVAPPTQPRTRGGAQPAPQANNSTSEPQAALTYDSNGMANLALLGTAKQSTNLDAAFSQAGKAIDGSTNGAYTSSQDNSVSRTQKELTPWWEVDLGKVYDVDHIVIWSSTDAQTLQGQQFALGTSHTFMRIRPGQYPESYRGPKDYYIAGMEGYSDSNSKIKNTNLGGLIWQANQTNFKIDIKRQARVIRLFLPLIESNFQKRILSLAEVQVFGK